ncbi:MAG: response regulator [Deltaproteobacteria bacterium]|nr:response regulator [Deltaproteobacteria bacterium]MBM4323520.1 response regulator [Deltaproteobacteria bacterium]MBM4346611.1 response regulator [Deltaproteobacteria bacterium]
MAHKKKILIVDDERDIVKALTIRLQSSGYNTVAAFDGAQGVFMAYKERPKLIILDIRMPAGDGFSVAEKLKESKRTSGIPIIFVSGSPEKNAEERARELGVRFFIKKPYDPEELLDAVRRALETRPSDPTT